MSSPKTYIIIYVAKFNSVTLKFTEQNSGKIQKNSGCFVFCCISNEYSGSRKIFWKNLEFFQKIVDNNNKILYNIFCQLDAPLAQLVRATGS